MFKKKEEVIDVLDHRNPDGTINENIITSGIVRNEEEVAPSEDDIRRKKLRKQLEFDLILSLDKTEIDRKECWFLMDCDWLNKWSNFVQSEDEDTPPGAVSTLSLLDDDKKPLQGLKSRIDYRGVTPIVYFV